MMREAEYMQEMGATPKQIINHLKQDKQGVR
jgi:hypothetical protein